MTKLKKINLLLVSLACCSVFIFAACSKNSNQNSVQAKQEVSAVSPVLMELPFTKELNGKVVSLAQVDIVARVNGFIEKINFRNGDIVNEGATLYMIEQTQYKADVTKAEADVNNYKISVKLAQINYQRQKDLYYNTNNSRSANPTSTNTLSSPPSAFQGGQAASAMDLEEAMSALSSAKANLKNSEANLEVAKANLSYTQINAPYSGKLGISNFSVGSMVGPTSGTLANLTKLNPIEVEFNPDEKLYLSNAMQRQNSDQVKVNLTMSDGNSYPQTGKVVFFDNKVDSSTGTIKLRAEFPNPDYILLPGQYVKVKLQMQLKKDVITIPQRAVMTNQGGEYVYTVNSQNVIESRIITTSGTIGQDFIVAKGLTKDDKVVVSGIQKIRDGDSVTVKSEGK